MVPFGFLSSSIAGGAEVLCHGIMPFADPGWEPIMIDAVYDECGIVAAADLGAEFAVRVLPTWWRCRKFGRSLLTFNRVSRLPVLPLTVTTVGNC